MDLIHGSGRLFHQRRALVTGASSGLGAHFAKLLASAGVECLFIAARRAGSLEKTAEVCSSLGAANVRSMVMDVIDEHSVATVFAEIERAGGIDLLVNNAGIATQGAALDVTADDFDRVMATNLRGAWLCARAAGRMMAVASGGDILNVASILGLRVGNLVAPYAICTLAERRRAPSMRSALAPRSAVTSRSRPLAMSAAPRSPS